MLSSFCDWHDWHTLLIVLHIVGWQNNNNDLAFGTLLSTHDTRCERPSLWSTKYAVEEHKYIGLTAVSFAFRFEPRDLFLTRPLDGTTVHIEPCTHNVYFIRKFSILIVRRILKVLSQLNVVAVPQRVVVGVCPPVRRSYHYTIPHTCCSGRAARG